MFYSDLAKVLPTGRRWNKCTTTQTEQKRCLLEKYLLNLHNQNSNKYKILYTHCFKYVFMGDTVHLRFEFPFKEDQLNNK